MNLKISTRLSGLIKLLTFKPLFSLSYTMKCQTSLFNLCIVENNASDLTLFISLLMSCCNTSAFRNVHFLIDLLEKNTHFPLHCLILIISSSILTHCTTATHCSFAFSDVMLAPIQTNVFTLNCSHFKL